MDLSMAETMDSSINVKIEPMDVEEAVVKEDSFIHDQIMCENIKMEPGIDGSTVMVIKEETGLESTEIVLNPVGVNIPVPGPSVKTADEFDDEVIFIKHAVGTVDLQKYRKEIRRRQKEKENQPRSTIYGLRNKIKKKFYGSGLPGRIWNKRKRNHRTWKYNGPFTPKKPFEPKKAIADMLSREVWCVVTMENMGRKKEMDAFYKLDTCVNNHLIKDVPGAVNDPLFHRACSVHYWKNRSKRKKQLSDEEIIEVRRSWAFCHGHSEELQPRGDNIAMNREHATALHHDYVDEVEDLNEDESDLVKKWHEFMLERHLLKVYTKFGNLYDVCKDFLNQCQDWIFDREIPIRIEITCMFVTFKKAKKLRKRQLKKLLIIYNRLEDQRNLPGGGGIRAVMEGEHNYTSNTDSDSD